MKVKPVHESHELIDDALKLGDACLESSQREAFRLDIAVPLLSVTQNLEFTVNYLLSSRVRDFETFQQLSRQLERAEEYVIPERLDLYKSQLRVVRRQYVNLERKLGLLAHGSDEELKQNIWWFYENGVSEDLDVLQAVLTRMRTRPIEYSEETVGLLESAIERIAAPERETVSPPADNLGHDLPEDGTHAERREFEIQRQGWQTYKRELPHLLQIAPDQWVAFHGEQRVTLQPSKLKVYEILRQEKYPLAEMLVCRIVPLSNQRIRPHLDYSHQF